MLCLLGKRADIKIRIKLLLWLLQPHPHAVDSDEIHTDIYIDAFDTIDRLMCEVIGKAGTNTDRKSTLVLMEMKQSVYFFLANNSSVH